MLDGVWQQLGRGVADRKHAFRTPVLATVSLSGVPRARTVVLRGAARADRQLVFHTDLRSPKVAELQANAAACLVFYDKKARRQIRAEGQAVVHHDGPDVDAAWARMVSFSRRCYIVMPGPGAPLDAPGSGLTPAQEANDFPEHEQALAREHFARVRFTVNTFDVLDLAHGGHRRFQAAWREGDWAVQWCVP
ncbi:MAG: pyridoxamine 5'-phosphate oxidase family protein [Myxococcota bacterium]